MTLSPSTPSQALGPGKVSIPSLDISVVVPVYNSSTTLATLLERLSLVLDKITNRYEVILVDDGSRDESWAVMQSLRASYSEHLVDDDLQNPPEEIPKMLAHIKQENLDLVYGCPDTRNHAAWRNLGSSIVWQFYRTVFRNPVTPTPFRIMRHQLAQSVQFYDLNFTYLDGLLAWCTSRIGGVQVEHHSRSQGSSGYSLGKLLGLALNLYTNFSLIPLQVVSALGFFTAASGFLVGFYYLVQFLATNIVIPGYASTIIAILILGGVQLLALGVIGELTASHSMWYARLRNLPNNNLLFIKIFFSEFAFVIQMFFLILGRLYGIFKFWGNRKNRFQEDWS